jgi:hypothetical protein
MDNGNFVSKAIKQFAMCSQLTTDKLDIDEDECLRERAHGFVYADK